MAYKQTILQITLPFWAIVKTQIDAGYSGVASEKTVLAEFNTALELSEALSDLSVTAGESEGSYRYRIIGMSHTWEQINSEIQNGGFV